MGQNRNGRMDKDRRRAAALIRTEKWEKLTLAQKVESLDSRLGIGVGAKKQRLGLQNELLTKRP